MFKRVIDDNAAKLKAPTDVKRVVFVSGKLFYELDRARADAGITDVALVRLEQVCA
jgi:2-oxoglutarate dehydrogenase complex dehydrogenase (E1) component-like enzyme